MLWPLPFCWTWASNQHPAPKAVPEVWHFPVLRTTHSQATSSQLQKVLRCCPHQSAPPVRQAVVQYSKKQLISRLQYQKHFLNRVYAINRNLRLRIAFNSPVASMQVCISDVKSSQLSSKSIKLWQLSKIWRLICKPALKQLDYWKLFEVTIKFLFITYTVQKVLPILQPADKLPCIVCV